MPKVIRWTANRVAVMVSEALGFSHFLIVNLLAILGETTFYFDFMEGVHGGINFVFTNIDAPVNTSLRNYFTIIPDKLVFYLYAELVFLLSSILYGLLCYFFTRLVLTMFQGANE